MVNHMVFNAYIFLSLGRVYEECGDINKAAELYRQVKSHTKDYSFKVLAKEGLSRMKK
jgi:predicted negative regulator of RcsB-dependent stress response